MATSAAGMSVKGRARFAAACGVLSQYVKAASAAAMEVEAAARPAPAVVALPLMPGADVSTTAPTEEQEAAGPASQMSIFYGGQVLVLDDVSADQAAEVLRLAAATANSGKARAGADLMPVARKASRQRFMEKRRSRVVAARASATPYSRPGPDDHGGGARSLTLSL